jgi:hypothetical protein
VVVDFAAQGNMGVKRPVIKGKPRRPEPFTELPPDVHKGRKRFPLVSGAYPPEFFTAVGKTTGTGKQKLEGAAANRPHDATDGGKPPFLCLPQKSQGKVKVLWQGEVTPGSLDPDGILYVKELPFNVFVKVDRNKKPHILSEIYVT